MLGLRAGRYKLLVLAAAACLANAGQPKSIALENFELIDDMRTFSTEESRREDDRRLALIGGELAREFERRGLYRVVREAPGAERAAVCWVQKVSNLILNINIEVRSAAGERLYASSVDIRGNTDESWLRGVRRLVDNIEARQQHLR